MKRLRTVLIGAALAGVIGIGASSYFVRTSDARIVAERAAINSPEVVHKIGKVAGARLRSGQIDDGRAEYRIEVTSQDNKTLLVVVTLRSDGSNWVVTALESRSL